MTCNFKYLIDSVVCSGDFVQLKRHSEEDIKIIFTECGLLPENLFESHWKICASHFANILQRNNKRSRRSYCEIPQHLNTHPEANVASACSILPTERSKRKRDRILTFENVVTIRDNYGIVLPVGTRK